MARRDDILNAVYEAERLHKDFDTKTRAEGGDGRQARRRVRPVAKSGGAGFSTPDRYDCSECAAPAVPGR